MSTLTITRGLPGSGKTTYAKRWVSEDSSHRSRLNRDDFREMMHGGAQGYPRELENAVTFAHRGAVLTLLKSGRDVICDDMNLQNKQVKEWMKLAAEAGADFAVVDLTNVWLETCIDRDRERGSRGGHYVGAEYIEGKYEQFIKGRKYPLPLPEAPARQHVEPYVAPKGKPKCILVDIDGTMALMNGRGPYDWHRVGEDQPNKPVVDLVHIVADYLPLDGDRWGAPPEQIEIIFLSGRDGSCQDDTVDWLTSHGFEGATLFMRAEGDMRPDHVVKLELFDKHIRDQYDVQLVLDDRNQVVDMWRRLGLTCLQVAPGDF